MEVEFNITTPNFLHTDKGLFPVSYFSEKEIDTYLAELKRRLMEKRKEQMEAK